MATRQEESARESGQCFSQLFRDAAANKQQQLPVGSYMCCWFRRISDSARCLIILVCTKLIANSTWAQKVCLPSEWFISIRDLSTMDDGFIQAGCNVKDELLFLGFQSPHFSRGRMKRDAMDLVNEPLAKPIDSDHY
jgi:hypothetical protein